MQRRIIGSYQESHEVVREVERLMNEGYVGEEILIITDNKASHQKELENLTLVEVDSIDPKEEKSFWEKAKEALSFGKYDSEESHGPLSEYGVSGNEAESYEQSLQDGNILLLVNNDAPAQLNTAVNDEQTNRESHEDIEISKETMKEDYEPTPGDEEMFDPSKAQSSREDKLTEGKKLENTSSNVDDKRKATPVEGNGDIPSESAEKQRKARLKAKDEESENLLDNQEAPQLTGDETSVEQTEGTHRYPDSVNEGPVNKNDEKKGR